MVVCFSFLSPTQISSMKLEHSKKRFSRLVEDFQELGHIIISSIDKALKQYSSLVINKEFINETKNFNAAIDCIGDFYLTFLASLAYCELEFIISLILAHGNVYIESAFNVNEVLQVNMKEHVMVTQRLMYEDIDHAGGVAKVSINSEMC